MSFKKVVKVKIAWTKEFTQRKWKYKTNNLKLNIIKKNQMSYYNLAQ